MREETFVTEAEAQLSDFKDPVSGAWFDGVQCRLQALRLIQTLANPPMAQGSR